MQSCNAERPRQRERPKKVYLAKNNFARLLSTLFLHFFAVVLHDYNVKLLSYTFYGGNDVFVPVRFFLKPSFTPLWPLAFLNFSLPLQNFQIFLPTKFVSFVSYLSVRGGVGGQFPRNVKWSNLDNLFQGDWLRSPRKNWNLVVVLGDWSWHS